MENPDPVLNKLGDNYRHNFLISDTRSTLVTVALKPLRTLDMRWEFTLDVRP